MNSHGSKNKNYFKKLYRIRSFTAFLILLWSDLYPHPPPEATDKLIYLPVFNWVSISISFLKVSIIFILCFFQLIVYTEQLSIFLHREGPHSSLFSVYSIV